MAQHTRAPWTVERDADGRFIVYADACALQVAQVETEADALLIAAAPLSQKQGQSDMRQHLHCRTIATHGGIIQTITTDTSPTVLLEVEEEGCGGRSIAICALTPAEVDAVIAHLAQARDAAETRVAGQLPLPLGGAA